MPFNLLELINVTFIVDVVHVYNLLNVCCM